MSNNVQVVLSGLVTFSQFQFSKTFSSGNLTSKFKMNLDRSPLDSNSLDRIAELQSKYPDSISTEGAVISAHGQALFIQSWKTTHIAMTALVAVAAILMYHATKGAFTLINYTILSEASKFNESTIHKVSLLFGTIIFIGGVSLLHYTGLYSLFNRPAACLFL